ncbi:DUF885 domain-containing protein [Dethiobacter alkaliphilus]|uniref:DUF885 domain-containing protein n=1 Tax=Dethiobacter alkaliphilus AHT 1 TaxID=555088 RepID=C0GHX0_DETAL|nr:DUF885 domain-containing protein [Dethiobacter alkaliphilus]EEG77044.1 protein of unknown function DUF885 [Dethiobacter alkaliphilus AHT 1]
MNETNFQQHVETFVMWHAERSPTSATNMGIHTWDHKLADCRLEAIEAEAAGLEKFLQEFQACQSANYTNDGQVDHTLVVQLIKSMLRNHNEMSHHRRNPGYYLSEILNGVFSLILKDFAPWQQRQESLAARIAAAPAVLKEAKNNLEPDSVPRVWAEVALEQARMGPGLFLQMLPAMADSPEAAERLKEAGRETAAAMDDFARWLSEVVLPQAAGDFAVQTPLFDQLLKENHMVDYDSEELLATGWKLFEETKTQMETLAQQIDPHKTVEEIIEDAKNNHPTADGLLDAVRQAMEAARSFVMENNIATIPEGEQLDIIETPLFLRPLIPFAAYIPPGIYDKSLTGVYMTTPPNPDDSPEVAKGKLKGQHYAKLPVTALHEAYPGHHLQLVTAVKNGTTARKLGLHLSTLFIEGWAFYCEELMEQTGFIAEPVQKLGRLHDQLWRAARIILDVSLHCKGMSIDEAVDFLVTRCQLEPANALAEIRRYTLSPTQPQSYLMGKLEIMKIVDEYKQKHPGTTLKTMHDHILACGSLPPRLLHKALFAQ